MKEMPVLYQYSSAIAVQQGLYDGDLTIEKLKTQGTYGLGSFNALEGELIVINGNFYHGILGKPEKAKENSCLSWAAVTNFTCPDEIIIDSPMSFDELQNKLIDFVASRNLLFAFHLQGKFSKIKLCSVPKQNKPYQSIERIIEESSEFTAENIEGDIVGFYAPAYMNLIKSQGYHLHFVDRKLAMAGHVLDFQLETGKIDLQKISKFLFEIPASVDFAQMKITIPQSNQPIQNLNDK